MLTDYATQSRNNNKKKPVGLIVVVLLHVLVIYAMMSGLANKTLQIVKKPLETKIIEEVKPPPPPPPPPPPEVKKPNEPPPPQQAPPPPFVPPPEVQVAVQSNAPQITSSAEPPKQVYEIKPPVPPAPPAPPAPPTPPPPKPTLRGVVKAAKCTARPAPEYPAKAQSAGVGAEIRVHIYMGKDGAPVDVKIITNTAPDNASRRLFAAAVTESARGFRCEGSDETYILEQDFGFKPE